MLNEKENLKYQLETLASYEPADLDNPEFEVAYENESGCEGFATVCCIDLAQRGLARIKELEDAGGMAALHWSDAQSGYQSDELINFREVIGEEL